MTGHTGRVKQTRKKGAYKKKDKHRESTRDSVAWTQEEVEQTVPLEVDGVLKVVRIYLRTTQHSQKPLPLRQRPAPSD